MKIEHYENSQPTLRIEDYFVGRTEGWGMFQDRFGKVRNRFKVVMNGEIKNDYLVLDEDFFYEDGSTSKRIWNIQILGNGEYQGVADDVIGFAYGKSAGNAFNWTYKMKLPIGSNKWKVSFNDWLFLQQDDIILNVAEVTKWGITLGRLTFVFDRNNEKNNPH